MTSKKLPASKHRSSRPLVSVIVPTKNSAEFLDECLQSIVQQTYPNIELIVVDNHSSDDTVAIAKRYTQNVYTKGPERSVQVNYGAGKARGTYVYKVDSDFVLAASVVADCASEVQKGFDAIVVHNSPDVRVSWVAKVRKFEVDMYKYDLTHSSARFVDKKVYEAIGGFNPKITAGEDYDFQNKLNRGGYKTGFIAAEALHLGEPKRFWPHLKKYYTYGKDFPHYRQHNLQESRSQLGFVRKAYARHWRKFVRHPLKAGMFLCYSIAKYSAGCTGYMNTVVRLRTRVGKRASPPPKGVAAKQAAPKADIGTNPLVSIIIASKNTHEHVARCLESVRQQTYKHIELIVVDNFSSDGTYEIAKKYADRVYQKGPERSTQFNYGFSKSKGALIYRIGPDYVLEKTVVETCVQLMRQGYDALALHNRSVGDSIWAKVRYYERESYRNDMSIVAVRFMKREVFKALGGFDESLVAGEDFDLHNRMVAAGYTWTHADAVEDHIGEPKNIREVWCKFYYYGRTIGRYRQKNTSAAKSQLAFFRTSFKKVQRSLLKKPHLFVVFWVYMIIKYTAGFFGMVKGAPNELPSNDSRVK